MSRLFPYFFGEKQDIPRFSSYQKKNASPQEIRPFFILLHDFSMKKDTPPDVSFQGRTFGRRRLSCISSDPGRVCGRSFRNIIKEDEREAAEENIWKQINALENDNNDYLSFFLKRKDSTVIPVLDHGRLINSRYYGNIFYVFIIDHDLVRKCLN